jgi:hypothetical protein
MELLKDRNYYRAGPTVMLLEYAVNDPTAELAIVLGERLEEAQAAFDDKIEQFVQSTFAKVDDFKVEIQGLAAELTEE